MNTLYLRRRRKVYLKAGSGNVPLTHIAAMQKNLECLGFVLSEPLLERLRTLSIEKLGAFYKNLVKDLREMVGAHRVFKPMYPNFPEQVMEMSTAELYFNAILHYLSNRLPNYAKNERPALLDNTELRRIDLGSREDFESIFTQLAASRTSLSAQDKADLAWFVAQYRDDLARLLPPEIPLKENLAVVGAQLLRHTTLAESFLASRIRTATDVLRLAVAMSDGDVSLAEPAKFVTFKRRERKCLLSLVERAGEPTEDMLRWKERWKRLGERLHPGDYSEEFPKTYAAFQVLRQDKPFAGFNAKIERNLLDHNVAGALEVLRNRPGDLVRRLDHLLRLGGGTDRVLDAFGSLTPLVSTPVLLQALTHFQHRVKRSQLRTFFPKGDLAKVQAIANQLPPLPSGIPEKVVVVCEETLISRFAKLPRLGKCYLEPEMANYLVPFSQRSAAKSLRTLVRGSRLPMPESKAVRFFVWWKNGSSRTDIDLSAALYDRDFQYIDVVSYYNLKNFGGHHSGDIVDAPNGAAEFIDLDIARTLAGNVRYVAMSLNSFTEQPYCDLPECFAGWMARTHVNSGEIFEAKTVEDKVDIAANTRICIPAILDLVARQVIWTDIALRKHPSWNNVRNNLSGVSLMVRAMCSLVKPDLATLFRLHIRARGEEVPNKEATDCVFSVKEGITPFHLDRIASEFM